MLLNKLHLYQQSAVSSQQSAVSSQQSAVSSQQSAVSSQQSTVNSQQSAVNSILILQIIKLIFYYAIRPPP